MLILTTVEYWEGFPNRLGQCILNTRRMSKVVETPTGSKLLYSYHEGHRKGETDLIFVTATPDEINAASEAVPLDDFYMFLIYPDEDINKTGVFTHIKMRDIVRMKTYSPTTCALWVQHNEVRLRRYRVLGTMNWNLAEMYSELN